MNLKHIFDALPYYPVVTWLQIQLIGLMDPGGWRADITAFCQLALTITTIIATWVKIYKEYKGKDEK